jgi:IS605 OrfB family transposase
MGIVPIASDSAGESFSGSKVNNVGYQLRVKLQKAQSRSAKRHLKKLAGKESSCAQNINHTIAKKIVEKAKRSGIGMAVEDLKDIRTRIRPGKSQRTILHSGAFAQLGAFLKYKAAAAGVALVEVDARYTSGEWSQCGHMDQANRPSQSRFRRQSCTYTAHADDNAALKYKKPSQRQ